MLSQGVARNVMTLQEYKVNTFPPFFHSIFYSCPYYHVIVLTMCNVIDLKTTCIVKAPNREAGIFHRTIQYCSTHIFN